MAFILPREAISQGQALVHLTRTVWLGDAHHGSSAPEREILHSTEPVALLKKLQLLADGIPPADPTGRASRRPNKDGVRHGEPSYDKFVE
jgi:hypothetical protein